MSEVVSPFISVVSPVYKAADLVDLLVTNVSQVLRTLTPFYEIILVDDGSPDAAWFRIEQNAQRLPQVKGLKLNQNYGQHKAIAAGLKFSTGQWVVVLDCDLQDNPLEIPQMLQKAQEGFKIVLAQRINKKHPPLKILLSQVFNQVLSFISNIPFDSRVGNFGLYHREVINSICQKTGKVQYFPMMVQKVNFPRTVIEIEHQERPAGNSSYNIGKKLKLAVSVLFSNFSDPLKIAIQSGVLLAVSAGLLAVSFDLDPPVNPESSLSFKSMVLPTTFLFSLGAIGFYVAKILNKRESPTLIQIEKKVNFNAKTS